ncbi:MAG: Z1 domain-containing protein [Candidatus Hodarchaeota archaeon]
MADFDLSKFKNLKPSQKRYERRINYLNSIGLNTQHIEETVKEASINLNEGVKSFVVYGEPQSGKTEMMIALTAKLLDEGYKIIIVLLNDIIQLLNQNLERFRKSNIDPHPVNFLEILEEEIGDKNWIIFCKKNNKDLKKLIDKLHNHIRQGLVIIDDEADYASPNAKINRQIRTAINNSIFQLLGREGGRGIYIGVTATPARLDLNNTFDNISEKWVCFNPHEEYVGKEVFFPLDYRPVKFRVETLPDKGDDPKYLQEAIKNFLVNVAYINLYEDEVKDRIQSNGKREINFSFLVHTSGRREDHTRDHHTVLKVFDILSDENSSLYGRYVESLHTIAESKYGSPYADEIVKFILMNRARKAIVKLNTDRLTDTDMTDPLSLFTIAIGGNIISRGVTFNNLLGMFFTRDVKHRMQQDTYIQRARMFGNRNNYIKFFELWIPQSLYLDWHKCFVYHYLSLEAIRTERQAPVWISDNRVVPLASSSIDKRAVVIDRGEMYFGKFIYSSELEDILNRDEDSIKKLTKINNKFGEQAFPLYVINFIKSWGIPYEGCIAIHSIRRVREDSDYHDDLYRKRGVIGGEDIKNFPQAVHHIMVITNTYSQARVVYRYVGKVQFLKKLKRRLGV